MSLIGYGAIVASFLLIVLFYDSRARIPFLILLAVPVFQLIGLYTSLAFINARPTDTDTITYFYDLFGSLGDTLKPGTSFIVYLTHYLTALLHASFEDMMAIFSLSGVAASFLLLRYPALAGYDSRYPLLPALAVLLPTFHFYTTAIGKDGLSALAIVLIMIGGSDFKSRWRTLGGGFLLLVLVRPHIAAAAALAFLAAQMISSGKAWARFAVIIALFVGSVGAYYVFRSFLGINIFDLNEVSMFLGERSDALATSSYTISASDNIFVRIVGFMYFPLFFNADSALALAASFENLILAMVTLRIATTMLRRDVRTDSNVFFLIMLMGVLWIFMGATSYNIGLGLRTKTALVTPVLLALFALTEALRRQPSDREKRLAVPPSSILSGSGDPRNPSLG